MSLDAIGAEGKNGEVFIADERVNVEESLLKIADELTDMKIPKADGSTKWTPRHISYILTNVRYKGDSLHQKSYTTEFPFKSKVNRGELDMYYMENANPPIVSEELFDKVNELLKRKSEVFHGGRGKERTTHPLSQKIYCGECGNTYRKKSSQNMKF